MTYFLSLFTVKGKLFCSSLYKPCILLSDVLFLLFHCFVNDVEHLSRYVLTCLLLRWIQHNFYCIYIFLFYFSIIVVIFYCSHWRLCFILCFYHLTTISIFSFFYIYSLWTNNVLSFLLFMPMSQLCHSS